MGCGREGRCIVSGVVSKRIDGSIARSSSLTLGGSSRSSLAGALGLGQSLQLNVQVFVFGIVDASSGPIPRTSTIACRACTGWVGLVRRRVL